MAGSLADSECVGWKDAGNVLRDVITIADEVDSQLKQAMLSHAPWSPGSARSAA
jgi:hypothetical protein